MGGGAGTAPLTSIFRRGQMLIACKRFNLTGPRSRIRIFNFCKDRYRVNSDGVPVVPVNRPARNRDTRKLYLWLYRDCV